jgi:amino acid permease
MDESTKLVAENPNSRVLQIQQRWLQNWKLALIVIAGLIGTGLRIGDGYSKTQLLGEFSWLVIALAIYTVVATAVYRYATSTLSEIRS